MHSNPYAQVRAEFADLLKKAIASAFREAKISEDEILQTITTPKSELGDISSSVAFRLSKTLKRNPHEIAAQVAKHIQKGGTVAEVSELNSYINVSIGEKKYSGMLLESVANEKEGYGMSDLGNGERVIVEFPSVNPNKPWHVGHVRNALLGTAISNMMSFCGYDVVRSDYIDDLGLQMAESLWGWQHLSSKPDKKLDQWLGEQYVEVNKEMKKPGVEEEIKASLKKMEDGNSKEAKTVREIAERCVAAQSETAFAYGVYHDTMVWESDIVRAKLLDAALDIAAAKGIIETPKSGKYANATIVRLERVAEFAKELAGNEEEAKVIVRSNGAATYVAKDFAFHMWKFGLISDSFRYKKLLDQPNGAPIYVTAAEGERMNFGRVKKAINIIGSAQKYEQLVLKSMFYLLGRKEIAEGIIHLAYGEVKVEGGNLSTRQGTWIGSGRNFTADDLLREVKAAAYEIVSKSEKIKDSESFDSIANAVALAAIKFEFLKMAPESAMTFSWERALSFEGDSGPYCLYTYARAARVLEKESYKYVGKADASHIGRGQDFELIKMIAIFPDIAEKAASEHRPSVIADYMIKLASSFSKFYETMPIIKGGEAKEARLALTYSFKQTMGNALRLLGIEPLERM
ncbi:MAG: arginine--tRNA ligase [Candidatus Micrarchaeota archaeon]|nr:arginine--tRNA ligase [Candidatus Micrarchaeota archaeon]